MPSFLGILFPCRFFWQFVLFFTVHQMSLGLFRFIAAVGRNRIVAKIFGSFFLLIIFVLIGFIISIGIQNLKLKSNMLSYASQLIATCTNIWCSWLPIADDIKGWWIWGYWISPLMYAQNGIAVNEFLETKWQKVSKLQPQWIYKWKSLLW